MSIFNEFKEFALKGSVVDLAIGVIIGAAFGTIVSSLVDDIIMPPIGLALAGIDFSTLRLVLQQAQPAIGEAGQAGFVAAREAVAINYGSFFNAVIKFAIIAWVLFLVIRGMNALKRQEAAAPPAPPEPSEEAKLLAEIRDALKK